MTMNGLQKLAQKIKDDETISEMRRERIAELLAFVRDARVFIADPFDRRIKAGDKEAMLRRANVLLGNGDGGEA